jgi:phosphatidylglycerol:prolipoprotein diacylglycerol transferase
MRPPFNPILIPFSPGFGIHWYGVLIVVGIMAGAYYAAWRARQDGENPDHVWNGIILAIVFAIIGARLYHVFSEPAGGAMGWSYYREHPIEILYIWNGGLGIYGAALGGALGVMIYAWYAKLRPLQWLDYGAPAMVLGQAIGRWGNFINQELYGPPTGSSWWGLIIDKDHRILPYCAEVGHRLFGYVCSNSDQLYPVETTLFHPTFLYESLWCLLVFVALALMAHKWKEKLLEGDILWGYLIGYPLGRFFIEQFFRPDAWKIGSLAAAQWFAIACVIGGAATLIARHVLARRAASAEEVSADAGEEAPAGVAEGTSEENTTEVVEEASESSDDAVSEPGAEA